MLSKQPSYGLDDSPSTAGPKSADESRSTPSLATCFHFAVMLALPLFLVTFAPTASALPSLRADLSAASPRVGGLLGSDVTMSATFSTRATRFVRAAELDPLISAAALAHGVSPSLIRAVIQAESDFDAMALSSKGACGLMQLMPGTARRFGVVDCFDARQNVLAGTGYLKELLARYDGSIPLSVAAYNAGMGAVARHGGIPPYRQTLAYVQKVQDILAALGEAELEVVDAT